MRIQDEAQGLGLKRVMVEAGWPIGDPDRMLLAGADLALFAAAPDRDAALDRALRTVPRTATLRHRFRLGGDAPEILAAIATQRPRTAAVGVPQLPKRVFYWAGMTAQPLIRMQGSRGRWAALSELG